MRIAEINDIASVASGLSDGLRARGHDVTVIRPRLLGGSLPWMIKPVVAPIRAVEWAQIIREIHAGRFDIAHIHYAYLGMLGVLGRFPYILHCHGSDVREITPFTRPMIERALHSADKVYYATPDLASYVLERRQDAAFLPNPVDTDEFQPLTPASDRQRVFICCALADIKGAPRLLDACRRLARQRPDISITAIAGGEYTDEFRLLPNVRLIPHVPRRRFPEIISEHGVVIGQVLLGAIGMAELESMSCGRPVICWYTYDRAYPEPPPLVRALDGFDIAGAVIRLVDNPTERQGIGERSRDWIRRYHDLDRIAEQVERAALEVIERVASGMAEGGAA